MIFTSLEYIIFFAAVLLALIFIRTSSAQKWFLLGCSYAFYMTWNFSCILLLFIISLVNYDVGLRLGRTEDNNRRKLLLALSLITNLGVLGFFKYTNFVVSDAWSVLSLLGVQVPRWHYDIVLPVGISFFTFQSMTYTIEVFRRSIKPCVSARDLFLFVAFFPQLLAGPINRATEMLPQFQRIFRTTALNFESGLAQFALGAAKKLVISDRVAPHVDLIFSSPGNYDALTLLQGLLGYAIQIYCDFSGYSDMAIGSARMMGLAFKENFQMPYAAVSITEFWRRWHISLSTWFRDYLYIPLGGNHKGLFRTYINLLLTMLLCGLWHGASWNFILWGCIHGISLIIHRVWTIWRPMSSLKIGPSQYIRTTLSHFLTLTVVIGGWIFFRADSWEVGVQYLYRLLTWQQDGLRVVSPYILASLVVMVLVHLMIQKDWNWALEISKRPAAIRVANYLVLAFIIACLGSSESSPFIYFQF